MNNKFISWLHISRIPDSKDSGLDLLIYKQRMGDNMVRLVFLLLFTTLVNAGGWYVDLGIASRTGTPLKQPGSYDDLGSTNPVGLFEVGYENGHYSYSWLHISSIPDSKDSGFDLLAIKKRFK